MSRSRTIPRESGNGRRIFSQGFGFRLEFFNPDACCDRRRGPFSGLERSFKAVDETGRGMQTVRNHGEEIWL